MKYLVLLLIVLGGIWWIRQQRNPSQDKPRAPDTSGPQTMLPCAHCGAHVPEADAVQGARGVYCSAAHQQAHEA